MSDDLDQLIRQAASAHLALAPARVLTTAGLSGETDADDLVGRALRRLDDPAYLAQLTPFPPGGLEAMMMSESDHDPESDRPVAPPTAKPASTPAVTEDSGLHDIRALAQNTKQRISRRIPTVTESEDASWASTTGQLKAIALPEPARLVALPELPATTSAKDLELVRATASAVEARGPVSAAEPTPITAAPRKRTALWLGLGGVVAAAAAAAVVMSSGGGGKKKPAAEQVAAAPAAAPVIEPAAPPPPPSAAPMGASGLAVAGAGSAAESDAVVATAAAGTPTTPPAVAAPARSDEGRAGKPERAADDAGKDKPETDKDRPAGGTGKAATEPKPGAGDKQDSKVKAGAGPGSAATTGGGPGGGGGGEKSIDDLLGDATGGGKGGGDAAPKLEKKGLDGKDIKSGMGPIAGRAQACYDEHGVAGHVKVKAVVDPSGKVTKVDAVGEFAGTPTGKCVAAAVLAGAKFPAWDGAPMTINYGYTLNE